MSDSSMNSQIFRGFELVLEWARNTDVYSTADKKNFHNKK